MKTTTTTAVPFAATTTTTAQPFAEELLRRAARVADAKRKFDDLEVKRSTLRSQLDEAISASAQAAEELKREESSLVSLARA